MKPRGYQTEILTSTGKSKVPDLGFLAALRRIVHWHMLQDTGLQRPLVQIIAVGVAVDGRVDIVVVGRLVQRVLKAPEMLFGEDKSLGAAAVPRHLANTRGDGQQAMDG